MIEYKCFVLTFVLKLWGFLVLIEVALRIYNSVSLLKMIRTLLADSISMMRKGSNTCVCGTGLPLCYKLKEPGVIHASDNKIKYKAQYEVVASKDIILVGQR